MNKKNILIIGGSTGIGFNISKYCYENGSNILISSGSDKIISAYKNLKLMSDDKKINTIEFIKINLKKKINFNLLKRKIEVLNVAAHHTI